jgi:hypothetical protein
MSELPGGPLTVLHTEIEGQHLPDDIPRKSLPLALRHAHPEPGALAHAHRARCAMAIACSVP